MKVVSPARPNRPLERMGSMTVCIAALCRNADNWAIVLCADGMGSTSLGTKERSLKIRVLPHKWRCLTAGNEDDITPMLQLLNDELRALAEPPDETNVIPAVQKALRTRKEQKANDYTAQKWGMSFSEFRKSRSEFPDEIYRKNIEAIGQITIDVDLLVCGFSKSSLPMIVQVHGYHGVCLREDFAVAGEGSYLAQYGLLHRQHYEINSLDRTIYCVYEAKKYAERVSSVGKVTYFVVIQNDTKPMMLTYTGIKELETKFASYGPHAFDEPSLILPAGSFKPLGD